MSIPFRMDLLLKGNLGYPAPDSPMDFDYLPFWYLWDGNLDRLTEQIQEKLFQLFAEELAEKRDDDGLRSVKRRRTFWCLDRLLPLDRGDVFHPLLGAPIVEALGLEPGAQTPLPFAWPPALYAWARRLAPSERHRILAALSANEAAIIRVAGPDPFDYYDRRAETLTALERFSRRSLAFSVEYGLMAWAETCPPSQAPSLLEAPALVDNDSILSSFG